MTQEKHQKNVRTDSKLEHRKVRKLSPGDNRIDSEDAKVQGAGEGEDCVQTIYDESHCKTYIIGKFLGKGAHARVYEASEKAEPTRQCALKLMNIEPSTNKWNRSKSSVKEVRLTQVMREVEIHGIMNHYNVVRLESYFQQDFRFCLVLEHCAGNNLARLLDNIGHMGETSAKNLLKQLVDGLEYIHSMGVIHRDLKPANIYLTQQMVIKIGDFGLADRVGSGRKGICGTPNYISPEALMEQGYTPAVDVWALGCIAYHMLAGKPPFDASTHSITYDLIRAHKYTPLISSQAGAAARHLIHWMLAFLPEERPSLAFVRNHVWMRRQQQVGEKTWSRRRAKRRTAPIAQPSSETTSCSSNSLQELQYERLCEKVSEISIKAGADGDFKNQSLWRNLLEKVKLKKSLSFHFLPSTLQSIRNKVSLTSRISLKGSPLKKNLEQILRVFPSVENIDKGIEVSGKDVPVFVAKWIDYSNKFGFGYQMTDGTTGVVFSDSSQICLDGTNRSVTCSTINERTAYPLYSVPPALTSRLRLLENFKEYMETQLSCGAPKHPPMQIPPMLAHWAREENAIVFQTSQIIQVNFLKDHYKLLLYAINEIKNGQPNYVLVTISSEKEMKKYELEKLLENGCPESLYGHITYIHSIL